MSIGLYSIKPWFVARLAPLEDFLVASRVGADALTYAALGAAAAAGATVAFAPRGAWIAVAPLCLARLVLNALDGSIARRTGAATRWGAALNEAGDRVADVLVLGGVALATGAAGAAALAAAMLASFTGVLALAHTGIRDYSGPMGKPDRTAAVALGAAAAAVAGSETPLVVAAAAIAVGSLWTAAARLRRLRAALAP